MNNQNSSNQINGQSNFNRMNNNMRNDFPNQKSSFNNEILNDNLLKTSTKLNCNNIKNNQNMNNQSLSQNNSLSLEKQNKEYKIKINNLEKYIKVLEIKLKEKDKIINEEKIKNDNLQKEIKNNSKIKELENEIKLFKSYYNFSEGENLISIKFISVSQDINYDIIVKNTEKFTKLESMLYEKYPKYIDLENFFLVHGNKISKHRSLKENKIDNNDVITLEVTNFD